MKISKIGRGVVVCAAVGVVAVAVASGASAANSGGDGAPAAKAKAGKGALIRAGGRLEHAEATVRTKQGDRTVLVQRGVISALNDDAMTVRSLDGWTGSWTLTDSTRVREHKAAATAAALKVGDTVVVRGAGNGQSGTAKVVRDRGVVAPKAGQAS